MTIRQTRKGKIVYNPGRSLPYTVWVGIGTTARVVKFVQTEEEADYIFRRMKPNGDLPGSKGTEEEDTEIEAEAAQLIRRLGLN